MPAIHLNHVSYRYSTAVDILVDADLDLPGQPRPPLQGLDGCRGAPLVGGEVAAGVAMSSA